MEKNTYSLLVRECIHGLNTDMWATPTPTVDAAGYPPKERKFLHFAKRSASD